MSGTNMTLSGRRLINTDHRFSGSATNGIIRVTRVENATSFKIDKVAIFNNELNVNSRNNKIYFTVSSTLYTGTILPGRYTGSTIASAIETAMDSELSGNTVTYDLVTNTITISRGDNLILNTTMTTSAIWRYIGFTTDSDFTGNLSYQSDEQINLVSKYMYLTLDIADNSELAPYLPDDTALIIVNNQSFGTLISLNVDDIINTSKRTFEYIKYTLRSDRGHIIDSDGIGFSLMLTFQ